MPKYVDLTKKVIKCANCGGEDFEETSVHIDAPTKSLHPEDLVPEIKGDAHSELMCTECNHSRCHHDTKPHTDDN